MTSIDLFALFTSPKKFKVLTYPSAEGGLSIFHIWLGLSAVDQAFGLCSISNAFLVPKKGFPEPLV